jgi:hypothetical protein
VGASAALAAPTEVSVGMHVVDLRSVDVRAQSFYADLYLWVRFNSAGLDEARLQAVQTLEPVNGKFDSKEVIDEKQVGDEKYVCWRVTGTFFFVAELKKYPFDTQVLPLTLEAASLEADEVVLVDDRGSYAKGGTPEARWGLSPTLTIPDYVLLGVERRTWAAEYPTNFGDPTKQKAATLESDEVVLVDDRGSYARGTTPESRWGLSPTLSIPDYVLRGVERKTWAAEYPTNFGDPTKLKPATHYSRYSLLSKFEREYWSYAFKILIPLLVILAMAYLVFFLPAVQLDTSASVAMTALLSCMAYNVAVSQSMPEIGYLVLSDKFFIGTYVLLLLTLAQTFWTFVLDANGRGELALRIDRVSRVVFPLLVAGLFGIFLASV